MISYYQLRKRVGFMRAGQLITKKRGAIICVFLCTCIFSACQPTPEVPPMVNRGDGLPEGVIIDAVPEGEIKYIDAPTHLKETVTRRDGKVVINFNADIIVPKVSNTPVIEFQQMPLSDEYLKELVYYFAGDGEFFQIPPLTKPELEEELAALEKYKGSYNAPGAPGRTNMKNRLAAAIEEAGDERQWAPREIEFAFPQLEEPNFLMYGEENDELQAENTFEAFVKTNDPFASRITSTRYDTTVGSSSNFSYNRGIIFTEDIWFWCSDILELSQAHKNSSWFRSISRIEDDWIEEEGSWLRTARAVMDSVTIPPEEAKKIAQDALSDLGVSDMVLVDCFPGIQFCSDKYKQFQMNRLNFDPQEAKSGYTLTFSKDLGGLSGTISTSSMMLIGSNSVPDGGVDVLFPYAPKFSIESITFFITEEGIQMFKWNDMSQQTRVVAENTVLLPFNEVIGRFADHLNFNTHPDSREQFDVSRIELRSAYTTAFGAPDRAWLIPVWVFDYRNYFLSSDLTLGDEGVFNGTSQSPYSAIDGGWVMPQILGITIYTE